MLFIIEVDVQTETELPDDALDGIVRERLRGVSAHVPGGTATVTHCKRMTSNLLDAAVYGAQQLQADLKSLKP